MQEIGDFCDDTLSIFAIRDGQEHLINTLHHDNNALIMVEDVHVQMVFSSCERTYLQNPRGFMAQVTYQGIFSIKHFIIYNICIEIMILWIEIVISDISDLIFCVDLVFSGWFYFQSQWILNLLTN